MKKCKVYTSCVLRSIKDAWGCRPIESGSIIVCFAVRVNVFNNGDDGKHIPLQCFLGMWQILTTALQFSPP